MIKVSRVESSQVSCNQNSADPKRLPTTRNGTWRSLLFQTPRGQREGVSLRCSWAVIGRDGLKRPIGLHDTCDMTRRNSALSNRFAACVPCWPVHGHDTVHSPNHQTIRPPRRRCHHTRCTLVELCPWAAPSSSTPPWPTQRRHRRGAMHTIRELS